MPRYVIERNIPGAGKLSPAELHSISQKSCAVLEGMGPQIQWENASCLSKEAPIKRDV